MLKFGVFRVEPLNIINIPQFLFSRKCAHGASFVHFLYIIALHRGKMRF